MKRSDFSPDPRLALKQFNAHLDARLAHKQAIIDSSLPMEDKFAALLAPGEPKPLSDYIDELEDTCPAYYDYDVQAWVVGGKYDVCHHPLEMDCRCYSRSHAGEVAKTQPKEI
jgi:hypothetical protein